MVDEHNAQFIIATHSPILMAFPDATILSFDSACPAGSVRQVEHVTHPFVPQQPAQFLQHL
jgi:predicted ATPase